MEGVLQLASGALSMLFKVQVNYLILGIIWRRIFSKRRVNLQKDVGKMDLGKHWRYN